SAGADWAGARSTGWAAVMLSISIRGPPHPERTTAARSESRPRRRIMRDNTLEKSSHRRPDRAPVHLFEHKGRAVNLGISRRSGPSEPERRPDTRGPAGGGMTAVGYSDPRMRSWARKCIV